MGAVKRLPSIPVGHCDVCDLRMRKRTSTADQPYRYIESGLPDVDLIGIEVYVCQSCAASMPLIPRPSQLHRVIVRCLLDKAGPLMGPEIRFLRRFTNMTGRHFADQIQVGPEHLSRVENSAGESFGRPTDKLVRVVASAILAAKELNRLALQGTREPIAHWRKAFTLQGRDWCQVG